MDNITELKLDLEKANREEKKAHGEMVRCEQQMETQKHRLESLLDHRDECVNGLKTAKESGLSIVQMREYQLLLQHVNTTVQEQQEKVDISQIKHEHACEIWEQRTERKAKLQEILAANGQLEPGQAEEPAADTVPEPPQHEEHVLTDITGKRLHTSGN